MTTLKFSRILIWMIFIVIACVTGAALIQYYRSVSQSEALTHQDFIQQQEKRLLTKIQYQWNTNITSLVDDVKGLLPRTQKKISARLQIAETKHQAIDHVFYITKTTIFLSQGQLFRQDHDESILIRSLSDFPEYKRAEILEYRDQQLNEAVTIYEQQWLDNPSDFKSANALARCLVKLKLTDRAIKLYQHIIDQNPKPQQLGETPLPITAYFQLLKLFKQQSKHEQVKSLGQSFYLDLIQNKWKLPEVKVKLFKQLCLNELKQYQQDKSFKLPWQRLQRQAKQLEATKSVAFFIAESILPSLVGRPLTPYGIYHLASSSQSSAFLIIIPHRNNHLVIKINYDQWMKGSLFPLLTGLMKEEQIGLKLRYAEVEELWKSHSNQFGAWISVSSQFPDLKLAVSPSADWTNDVDQSLTRTQKQLMLGYGLFLGILLIIMLVIVRQIKLTELKSEFISHVSHELKTPLTAIRMLSELLDENPKQVLSLRQQYYAAMLQESIRLSRLIENLLDVSRIERKKKHLHVELVNMDQVLQQAITVFQNASRDTACCLKLELNSNVKIELDQEAIIQVIINLLDNAKKYSPKQTVVNLKSYVEDNRIVILVQDQGIGMTKSERRRAFKKFYQSIKSYEEQFKGVGLGLAIVRHIVHAHHGKIQLSSEKNKGTEVKIILPIKSSHRDSL